LVVAPGREQEHREHNIVHSEPDSCARGDAATKALGWTSPYFVDPTTIAEDGPTGGGGFVAATIFFTLDVADFHRQPRWEEDIKHCRRGTREVCAVIENNRGSTARSAPTARFESIARSICTRRKRRAILQAVTASKGEGRFVPSLDGRDRLSADARRTASSSSLLLAAAKVPLHTIAPSFSRAVNKGVDYGAT